ncbi:MAG: hypothetical protein AAGC88_17590 [Bacteroidota bacterium]
MKFFFLFFVTVVVIIVFWTSLSQDTVDDLPGDFNEEAFYRNENNTGPITRKYIVSLSDTLWQSMEQYGQMMPYTKYGSTTVYFFLKDAPIPKEFTSRTYEIPAPYKAYCIARYERNSSGVVSLVRFPYKSDPDH